MPSSYTTRLRAEMQGTGENSGTWGVKVNTLVQEVLEEAIAGVATVVMTDANYTLTTSNGSTEEARQAVLRITGTLSAQRNVICPTAQKLWMVYNNTTGAQEIVFKTSAGTGVTIGNGKKRLVYCDGTNVVDTINDLPSGTTIAGGTIPTVGTSGATVGLLNANKTDSGNNTYTGTQEFQNNLTLGNNLVLSLKETGGTNRSVAFMSLSNVVTFGNANNATSILGSAISLAARPTFNSNTALDTNNGAALSGATFTGSVTLSYANSRFTVQNTSGTASILRLGADSGNVWLGAVNNQDIYFITNNVEVARLTSGGDLRITAAPTAQAANSAGFRAFGARNAKTGAYSLILSDNGRSVEASSGTPTFTIEPQSTTDVPEGYAVYLIATSQITLSRGAGVTLYNYKGTGAPANANITIPQGGSGLLWCPAGDNTWYYKGDWV